MDERGQFVQALLGFLIAFSVFMVMIPVLDIFLNVSFNFLNGSTDISQVGAIQTLLGLIPFFIAIALIAMLFNTIFNRPPQEGI